MKRTVLLSAVSLLLFHSCRQETPVSKTPRPSFRDSVSVDSIGPPALPTDLLPNGKKLAPVIPKLFQKQSLDSLALPLIDGSLLAALSSQEQLLSKVKPRKNYRIQNLTFNIDQLEETIDILRSRQHTIPTDLSKVLDAYQIRGADRRGNVLFTGYFTPVIEVSEKTAGAYRYPIYDRPRSWSGPLPTRAQIEGEKMLDSLGLEIAYAKSKVDIYYMQVQGSGYIQYPDGRKVLLSYNGTNRHPYRSIEKYILTRDDWKVRNISITGIKAFIERHPELQDSILFHNPSYTFFKALHKRPEGAGNVPLTGGLSIAVDRRYLPLGSCILAGVPVYDKQARRVVGHDYRILLAQDVGGKIKGPGHIDFYFGAGKENREKAMRMRHYGQLWLLLPKSPEKLFSLN